MMFGKRRRRKAVFLFETISEKTRTVSVTAHSPKYEILTTGRAKTHPDDEWDIELGQMLATARALKSLATKLEKRASGLIKHKDDMKQRKPKG